MRRLLLFHLLGVCLLLSQLPREISAKKRWKTMRICGGQSPFGQSSDCVNVHMKKESGGSRVKSFLKRFLLGGLATATSDAFRKLFGPDNSRKLMASGEFGMMNPVIRSDGRDYIPANGGLSIMNPGLRSEPKEYVPTNGGLGLMNPGPQGEPQNDIPTETESLGVDQNYR